MPFLNGNQGLNVQYLCWGHIFIYIKKITDVNSIQFKTFRIIVKYVHILKCVLVYLINAPDNIRNIRRLVRKLKISIRGHDIFADCDLKVDLLLYFLSKLILKSYSWTWYICGFVQVPKICENVLSYSISQRGVIRYKVLKK